MARRLKVSERPTRLELFVLAVLPLKDGVMPYELVQMAGLSLGAVIPALRRMEKDGLVSRSRERGRRSEYRLTKKGREVAEGFWHLCLEDLGRADIGDVKRTLAIVRLLGGGAAVVSLVMEQLESMEKARRHTAEILEREVDWREQRDALGEHNWIGRLWEIARLKAEAEVFGRIAESLR